MSTNKSLRLMKGDTVILKNKKNKRCMHTVTKRLKRGYLLREQGSQEQKMFHNSEIYRAYIDGNLEHFAINRERLNAAQSELLDASWESWSEVARFYARYRENYVKYVDALAKRRVSLNAARERAARTIYRRIARESQDKLIRIKAVEDAQKEEKARAPVTQAEQDQNAQEVVLKEPSASAVRDWHRAWVAAGRDVRALIPQFHRRGANNRRYENKQHLQEAPDKPLCPYGAMDYVARTYYLVRPRVPISFAYKELKKICGKKIPLVTEMTLRNYITKHFSDYDEYKARYGSKKAYYKFHLFERREAPERPLQEVEIDHCLIDLFARSLIGHVARPWLTLLICRTTRCIIGIHIGFEGPSYAATQRALLHAISPKAAKSVKGIENEWFCHGIPENLITDRGKEFLSTSLKETASDLNFDIVNLPGRSPYLKGIVERFFGSLNVKVFWGIDGSTASKTEEVYDPERKARFTLEEITFKLVKWIVDDYHHAVHEAIGCTPAQKWKETVALHGVRPVPNFDRLTALTGQKIRRKIGNTGIQVGGITYASKELEELRKRRNGMDDKWTIRRDAYDYGSVIILDPEQDSYLRVPAVHQKTTKGITKFQADEHLRIARQLTEPGEHITEAEMEEAKKKAAIEVTQPGKSRRKSKYLSDGAFATPLAVGIAARSLLQSEHNGSRLSKKHAKKLRKANKKTNKRKTSQNKLVDRLVDLNPSNDRKTA